MNQPPRSGNKIQYIYDNQSSRPPLLQKEGKLLYPVSHSSQTLRLTAKGMGVSMQKAKEIHGVQAHSRRRSYNGRSR
jgi:hypothetical protein